MSSKAEELAASLESGEMGDEKYLGGTGGRYLKQIYKYEINL